MTVICVHTWICDGCGALESQSATIDGNSTMDERPPIEWNNVWRNVKGADLCQNCLESINKGPHETSARTPPAADARVGESPVFTDSLRGRGFFGDR